MGILNGTYGKVIDGLIEITGSEYFTKMDEYLSDLKEKVKLIQEKRAIEKRQQEEAEQKRLENAIPLSEKIAKVQKLPTLYGNVKQWMKQNGFDVLSEKDLGVLLQQIQEIVNGMKEKERKGLKSLGKDLDLLVGSDTATKWFKEIVKQ